jgi:hypothetical protein
MGGRVQDIPKELLGIAGTVIDHGLRLSRRWQPVHFNKISATAAY